MHWAVGFEMRCGMRKRWENLSDDKATATHGPYYISTHPRLLSPRQFALVAYISHALPLEFENVKMNAFSTVLATTTAEFLAIMLKVLMTEDSPIATAEIVLDAELKYIAAFHALVILVAIFGASVIFPLILTKTS